ncbi:amino acid permease-domain-containing protein [Aspergillus karnatakaensis]|uniref:amino acid permease-domain-containing protein n=1 Tax=Aspergillus karnatakaensis TaxID=1810916 RepID=UPI003CCE0AF7
MPSYLALKTLDDSSTTAIGNGGPVLLIWGQIGIALTALCMAVCLGELASAMPNAAGQLYWVSVLAPKRARRVLAYFTGMLAWASSLCIVTSGTPDFVYKPWMGFVGFQATNLFVFFFNTVGRFLPRLGQASLGMSVSSARHVFTDFTNTSGWGSGIAALTGLLGINWGYSCLDVCTHLAEEVPRPERNVPKALIATIVVGFSTAFPMVIALLFSATDFTAIITTRTLVPSLEAFRQACGTAGAIGLQSLVVVVFLGSIFGAHTWQSRLCWSFARQNGLPFSGHLSRIAPRPFSVPFYAHITSCVVASLLGFLYLGSTVAFNAFVGCGLYFQYTTYSICVICLFIRGRSTLRHGPFWLPRLGPFCGIVTVLWTVFSLIMYSFPPSATITPTKVTYAPVVYVGVLVITAACWLLHGQRHFVTLDLDAE